MRSKKDPEISVLIHGRSGVFKQLNCGNGCANVFRFSISTSFSCPRQAWLQLLYARCCTRVILFEKAFVCSIHCIKFSVQFGFRSLNYKLCSFSERFRATIQPCITGQPLPNDPNLLLLQKGVSRNKLIKLTMLAIIFNLILSICESPREQSARKAFARCIAKFAKFSLLN